MKKLCFVFLSALAMSALAQSPTTPQPAAAVDVSSVVMHPWPVITVPAGETATITMRVGLTNGVLASDLRGLPVALQITPTSPPVSLVCDPAKGTCNISSQNPGTFRFTVTSANSFFGYRTVYLVFTPKVGPSQTADPILVSASTEQGEDGEVVSGVVTFLRSTTGPHSLAVRSGTDHETTRYWYFPKGVRAGQRIVVLTHAVAPLDGQWKRLYLTATLTTTEGSPVATGFGEIDVKQGQNPFDVVYDIATRQMKVSFAGYDPAATYRVMLLRGSDFALELPVTVFPTGASAEAWFYPGSLGYQAILPGGRYTVALVTEYPYSLPPRSQTRFRVNGLHLPEAENLLQ